MNKSDFPLINNRKDLVYIDNAATTQKPQVVIDRIKNFYEKENANIHRGLYSLSNISTDSYEESRKVVAEFFSAQPTEIVFTSGTTDGMNILASSLQKESAQKVLLSDEQHHSALLPWQDKNYDLSYIPIDDAYMIDYDWLEEQVTTNSFDIIVLTHISNVTGTVLDLSRIDSILNTAKNRPILILDSAQSVGHKKIDVNKMKIDFMVGSGHKVYGPTGIGFLWGKMNRLESLSPGKFGGGMVGKVRRESSTWCELPNRFEAGTPPIAQVIGFSEAINYIEQIGMNRIEEHEKNLTDNLVENMKNIEGIKIYKSNSTLHTSIVSFSFEDLHAHDISYLLGDINFGETKKEVCVRAGHHCTQILHREVLKVASTARVSFGLYNDDNDIDVFLTKLKEVIRFLRKNDK